MSGKNVNSEVDCRYSSYSGPRRLLHWGPIVAIAIILWISIFTVYCDLMYWPISSSSGAINLSVFLTWVLLVFYHHYQASAIGPGFVPLKWKPSKPEHCENLQFCQVCQGYKAPRSHHCRKCNRQALWILAPDSYFEKGHGICVMKMDHHCPWINICCGHMNHASFTYFLFFAPIGCMHAFYILTMSLYYGLNYRWFMQYGNGTEPRIYFNVATLIGSMFGLGLAFGIILSVGILFIVQIKSIFFNRTGIEEWIERKSTYRDRDEDFVYPYDLGIRRNITQVLFTSGGWPRSNGFWWDVKEGCGQFDLTIEQKFQKIDKKERATEYVAVKSYSGSFLPITQGLCVCCCFPWTDEPRIAVTPGDKLIVTRWRKHWLYGDKVVKPSDEDDFSYVRVRGWFPRRCVVEVFDENGAGDAGSNLTENKKDK